ncbi:MAG: ATP-binding protein [Candidatus Omnitrophota bacterium]|nr:ATP-binding protein [Candidatus Omnitrophota bacterium]
MTIPVFFSSSPIHDREGKVQGYIYVAQDLTERKLLEDQLLQAQKLASLGRFVAGLSHEINASLIVILRYAQQILESGTDGGIRQKTEIVAKRAEHSHKIIQDLLTFVRPRQKRGEILNPCDLVDEMLEVLNPDVEKFKIKIERDYPDVPSKIDGDEDLLREVFMNLMVNAFQALESNKGERRFKVTASVEGQKMRLSFADNGPGIDKKDQSKIFEPFFTTKEVGVGTGLGLSLTYGIMKQHEGAIQVESELGQGTVFHLDFPRVPNELKSDLRTAEKA